MGAGGDDGGQELLRELCPDIGEGTDAVVDLNEEQLLQILDRRDKAREARDWDRADSIKAALKSAAGVDVYDKERCWVKADGTRGQFGLMAGQKCALSDLEIAKLLRERQEARDQRDFVKADAIKVELKGKGVETFDKEGMWVACDGRKGTYAPAAGS